MSVRRKQTSIKRGEIGNILGGAHLAPIGSMKGVREMKIMLITYFKNQEPKYLDNHEKSEIIVIRKM
jgi:hypothetical protein